MKYIKRFLSKILIAVFCVMLGATSVSATNVPMSDIGNYGTFATENNRGLLLNQIGNDLSGYASDFQDKIQMPDYVPIEARIGKAFINAMSYLSGVLEISLVRFVVSFMIILFIFWASFETYQMIQASTKPFELVQKIFKKAIVLSIWVVILEQGPAQLFMMIGGPIIATGTAVSDFILNTIGTGAGFVLSDTCSAIHNYMGTTNANTSLISTDQISNLLCMPSRLSGFFYTGINAGWHWMIYGLGNSAFTFLIGLGFIGLCIYNMWKFAIMAFGVIADLFMVLFMLPFTAFAQVFGGSDQGTDTENAVFTAFEGGSSGKTSYSGIAGQIFNQFLELFKTVSLSNQINKFIQASIYFVSLSIIIALCAGLLSTVFTPDVVNDVPTLTNDKFMPTLIVLLLVSYLASKTKELVEKIGGTIDSSFGESVKNDAKGLWKKAMDARKWFKK